MEIISDTAVKVTMRGVDEKSTQFIRTNSIAMIGTDGLMETNLSILNQAQVIRQLLQMVLLFLRWKV